MVTFYFRRGASASEFSLFFLSHSALGVYMHTYTHARALYTPWPCTFSTFAAVRDFESCVAEINGAFRIYLAHARSLHFSFRFDSSLPGAEDRLLFFLYTRRMVFLFRGFYLLAPRWRRSPLSKFRTSGQREL